MWHVYRVAADLGFSLSGDLTLDRMAQIIAELCIRHVLQDTLLRGARCLAEFAPVGASPLLDAFALP
jgi:hypothetical protein